MQAGAGAFADGEEAGQRRAPVQVAEHPTHQVVGGRGHGHRIGPGRIAAQEILRRWAMKPLDFDPGTRWQYSNTNYVIAGVIAGRVAGIPLMEFMRRRIFTPLGMTSATDFDAGPLSAQDADPLLRHALGPLRRAPKDRWRII